MKQGYEKMNIIIVGCGKIGSTILESLVEEGHDVVGIDTDEKVINEMTNMYDVMGVCGSGTDCEMLTEAGVENAEIFIAATSSDELNMISCFIARKMGAKHTIARIRNPEYNQKNLGFLKQQLDLSMAINPEMLAAVEMFNILKLPSAVKIQTFSQRNFEIIEMILKEGSALAGMKLMDLRNKFKAKFLVCVVQRGEEVYIPSGNFQLMAGDKIGLTASPSEIQKLMRSLGVDKKKAKDIMILGGSKIAYYLARMLTASGNGVKIVEQDHAKCEELSESLDKAVIIEGDGAQQELLLEEGLKTLDAFVALTGIDEENILISIFASTQKVPTVISKINRNELASMAARLGLDCIISPKKIVSDVIVRYARALENSRGSNVETLYNIMDDKAEVLEFNVRSDFKQVNIPLRDLTLKKNILIAGIIRDRKPIIPSGDDFIMKNDKVIVVVGSEQRLNDLSDIVK